MLTSSRRRELRARAHGLHPVVMIGYRGMTETVVAAIDQALDDHELIKIRLRIPGRDERRRTTEDLCGRFTAELVGLVGSVAIVYRSRPEERRRQPGLRARRSKPRRRLPAPEGRRDRTTRA